MNEKIPANSVGLVTPQIAKCDTPFTFANGALLGSHELVYETYGELKFVLLTMVSSETSG